MSLPIETGIHEVQGKLKQGDDFLLLDCREAEEHAIANLPEATLLPMSEIQQRLAELEPHRERHIIVHCHHGGRSLQVANWLRHQGYEQVQSMAGGIDAWSVEIDTSLTRY